MNKTLQDLKMEIKAIKKAQTEEILELENIGKRTGAIDSSLTNRIQEVEQTFSGVEDKIEEIDIYVKENVNFKKFMTQTIQEISDSMK